MQSFVILRNNNHVDKMAKEIEANQKKLTPEYLQYTAIINLINNTQLYFGDSIPKYLTNSFVRDDRKLEAK